MLLLPTGDVMFAREDDSSFYAYTQYGSPQNAWRPVIQACPHVFIPGASIQVAGLRFNGFSQAVGYGDDATAATNYPLVRIKNDQTGHVRYCRTFGHSTFDADLESGASELFVVANGIESLPFKVTVTRRKAG